MNRISLHLLRSRQRRKIIWNRGKYTCLQVTKCLLLINHKWPPCSKRKVATSGTWTSFTVGNGAESPREPVTGSWPSSTGRTSRSRSRVTILASGKRTERRYCFHGSSRNTSNTRKRVRRRRPFGSTGGPYSSSKASLETRGWPNCRTNRARTLKSASSNG